MLKSNIQSIEKMTNKKEKKSLKELPYYYPCFIDSNFALFTESELNKAINRGQKNKEHYLLRIEKQLKKIKRIKK
ncbi:hypothetical protein K9L16_04305 [Candidatus Pacearchaeota archaeon]|nr:hypothetical protein [Candidatus Pacearchaeota archaeon]